MSVLFASTPGQVAVIPLGTGIPGSIDFDNGNLGSTGRVIITGNVLDESVNSQFTKTLGNALYFYAFGDKIGAMTISGLAFSTTCNVSGQSGVEDVLIYYSNNRAIYRDADPVQVRVAIGQIPIFGYLLGCRTGSTKPEMMMYDFTLQLAVLPRT